MNQPEYNELYLEIIQYLLDDPYSELTQRRARGAISNNNNEDSAPQKPAKKRKKYKKTTTGRFETRAALVDHVLFLYKQTSCSTSRISKNCKISIGTVDKIVSTGE